MTPMTEAEFWSKWWPAVAGRFSLDAGGGWLRCETGDCPVIAAIRAAGGAVGPNLHVHFAMAWRNAYGALAPAWIHPVVQAADNYPDSDPAIRQRLLSFVPAAQGGLLEAQP